jgi:hypothetical protein
MYNILVLSGGFHHERMLRYMHCGWTGHEKLPLGISPANIGDTTNSFKLYWKRLINSLEIENDGSFEICMEIVVKRFYQN